MEGDGRVENGVSTVEPQTVADFFLVLLFSMNTHPSIIVQ